MTEHRIRRLFSQGHGLFGELETAAGKRFATMERLWQGNVPRVSCVRAGRYQLVRWLSKKCRGSEHVYALLGGDVGLKPGPGIRRTLIEIHPANVPLSLEGCIALGTLDPTGSILVSSRAAVLAFIRELDGSTGPHWLTIEGGSP